MSEYPLRTHSKNSISAMITVVPVGLYAYVSRSFISRSRKSSSAKSVSLLLRSRSSTRFSEFGSTTTRSTSSTQNTTPSMPLFSAALIRSITPSVCMK